MGASNSHVIGNLRRSLARKIAIDLSIMTVIGVIMALIGPFGSFGDPLAIRLMVWLGLAYAGYLIYSPMGWIVERVHQSLDLPRAWLWVAGTLIATVPMAMVVWSVGQVNTPAFRFPTAQGALLHYTYVLVIGGGVTLLFNVIQRPDGEMRTGAAGPAVEIGKAPEHPGGRVGLSPRLLERLPPELGSEVIALEMEDHYVRVHTALGNDLVLMRMRDAIAELDGIEGQHVHRSWWVARGAVAGALREGRNIRLQLDTGIEAPVSRANIQTLKDAGWI